ncbi:MAG: saccharopine dehydrogenase family protein [Thermoplasmata archaeon]
MDILLLGAGNVGKAIAYDLSVDYDVMAADVDKENLKKIGRYTDTMKIDASDQDELKETVEGYDLAICALPGRFGYKAVVSAIEAGTDIVDVSFMPENPLDLNSKAKENGVSVIVDAGFGPGMSNVFMGKISDEMDSIDYAIIRIGGLPIEPQPPLFYKVTWSPKDLIEEYTREARMKRDGEIVNLDPLEDINKIKIRGNEFEEFYSDGLRTLLHTIEVRTLEETTLRWKGHLGKIKMLRELGFFEEEHVDETLGVITPHMKFESKDFSIMDIHAEGTIDGKKEEINYYFYDEADELFSSMSRCTGFTTATMARLLVEKEIDNGVIPPEMLGLKEEYYDFVVDRIRNKGITIERT